MISADEKIRMMGKAIKERKIKNKSESEERSLKRKKYMSHLLKHTKVRSLPPYVREIISKFIEQNKISERQMMAVRNSILGKKTFNEPLYWIRDESVIFASIVTFKKIYTKKICLEDLEVYKHVAFRFQSLRRVTDSDLWIINTLNTRYFSSSDEPVITLKKPKLDILRVIAGEEKHLKTK